jgi:hypothetical protein
MQYHHPCRGDTYAWDTHDSEKLGRHAILSYAVEEVFADDPAWKSDKNDHGPSWYLIIGKTAGGHRLL